MYSRFVSRILWRRPSSNITWENITYIHLFPQQCFKIHGRFKCCGRKMSLWLQEQSIHVFKVCTRQCEFIFAQRVRRSVQIFQLYARIWDDVALRQFVKSWKCKVTDSTRNFLFGATGITLYNWDKERISNNEIYSYSKELDKIHELQKLTIICAKCHLRLIIDIAQTGVEYCQCSKINPIVYNVQEETKWHPFIERQDMIFWKRKEKDFNGLYAYKVYGSFDDVSAEDFLQVQIDMDYRKKWDATAKQLEIIDTDPISLESNETCTDVIYWEMMWPRMFANRDYVYQRKWFYDEKTGIVVIISKGTEHPNAPIRSDTHRVTNYWSYMVIKPYKNFSEPGIEFGLTYFDDPGVNLPLAFTAWIARSGLPDYLYRMRQAGKDYKNYKASEDDKTISKSINFINSTNNKDDTTIAKNKLYKPTIETKNHSENENTSNHVNKPLVENLEKTSLSSPALIDDDKELDNEQDLNEKKQGFLNYFFFAKLFV